jgi:monovalent cation/hydrogen antiporter
MLMFELILVLLLGAVVLTNLAKHLAAPYPSLLAIAGAGLAFLPFAPHITLEPDLALALFIAPALLDAAFDTSPRELRRNWIPVASLAVIAVVLTTAAVAFVGWRYAGLPLAAAIALGAIVAPPDAVAANEVLRHLRIPQRIGLILQGESLLNDATALLIYRAAVAAAGASFSLIENAPILLLAAIGSVAAGYVLARLYVLATAEILDAPSSTVLQFVGTFGVWILSERLMLSPIITVVTYAMTLAQL